MTPIVRWILRRASTGYCKRLSEVTGRVEGLKVDGGYEFQIYTDLISTVENEIFVFSNMRIAILSFSPRHEMDRLWERNTKFGPLTCDLIWGLFYRGSSEGKSLTFVGTQIQCFQLPKQNVWMEMGNLQKSALPKQLKIRHGLYYTSIWWVPQQFGIWEVVLTSYRGITIPCQERQSPQVLHMAILYIDMSETDFGAPGFERP